MFWSLFLLFLFIRRQYCTYLLIALRESRPCSWPSETKQTLNKSIFQFFYVDLIKSQISFLQTFHTSFFVFGADFHLFCILDDFSVEVYFIHTVQNFLVSFSNFLIFSMSLKQIFPWFEKTIQNNAIVLKYNRQSILVSTLFRDANLLSIFLDDNSWPFYAFYCQELLFHFFFWDQWLAKPHYCHLKQTWNFQVVKQKTWKLLCHYNFCKMFFILCRLNPAASLMNRHKFQKRTTNYFLQQRPRVFRLYSKHFLRKHKYNAFFDGKIQKASPFELSKFDTNTTLHKTSVTNNVSLRRLVIFDWLMK